MSLTPPPPPPLRSDPPADFIAKAEAYLSWQQTFVTEIEDAIQIAGITVWVSGTTYAVGDVVWSPTDYRTYRRIVAGAGTTDPASDAVNWQPLPLGAGTKLPVRVATTANITLSGGAPNVTNGVTLAAGDRILVPAQSTGSENGIYTVSTLGTGSNGTWTRATDADGAGDMFGGMLVPVSEGTANANSLWMLTTDDPITIGTTALAWERKDAQGLLTTANSWTGQQSFTGTAATAPAIAGASDPNTGVFFPAADTVGVATGGVERLRVNSAGNLLVTNPASLGYGTGAGGTVTQLTSKSTAVTLNTPAGKITTHNAALNGNTLVVFQFNNSLITTEDVVVFTFTDGNGVNYNVWAYALAAGNCQVALKNITAGSLSNAIPINFAIIKGATS